MPQRGTPVSDPARDLDSAVQRMLTGDEAAFRTVYRVVQPPLLRYLAVIVGTDDADDVASETWGQAFRDLGTFSGDADGFRGWITTIGRHRALDHVRRQSRRPQSVLEISEIPEPPDPRSVEGSALAGMSTRAVLDLLRRLPRDQAEAVMLRAIMGFDAVTAARILGKRPGAVRTASYRGLKRLAAEIGGPRPGVDDQRRVTLPPRAALSE
ncbi:MAG: RNA polymerase sigma factor [Propionicimonas sp.]